MIGDVRVPHPAILARVLSYDATTGAMLDDPALGGDLLAVGIDVAYATRTGRRLDAEQVATVLGWGARGAHRVWAALADDCPWAGGAGALAPHLPGLDWPRIYAYRQAGEEPSLTTRHPAGPGLRVLAGGRA